MKKNQFYIVRADRAGVFFGKIKAKTDTSVTMTEVRKIHYWDGACAVEQIAQDGVNAKSRLTVVVPEMEIANPIQIIPCSAKSTDILKGLPEWKK